MTRRYAGHRKTATNLTSIQKGLSQRENVTMHIDVNHCRIELIRADITEQEVDAIVNAANASLAGGGGVDGAIHRRGGPAIMRETDEKYTEGCPTGSAVASGAGNLKAKFVYHGVGPRWSGGNRNEPELLQSAYRSCLELAAKHECRSIAFPSISTGVYGFPIERAAPLAIRTVIDFLKEKQSRLKLVRFCLFSDADLEVYSTACHEAVSMPTVHSDHDACNISGSYCADLK